MSKRNTYASQATRKTTSKRARVTNTYRPSAVTRRSKGVKTNKQLTASVSKLWKNKGIKSHYVDIDNAVINQPGPNVTALTGIGPGDSSSTHEGNSIRLRGLNVHGRLYVANSGGVPTIIGPTSVTILIVRSELGTGVGETPTFDMLFRDTGISEHNFPLTQGFRTLDAESTTKVKILARRDMMLEAHGPYTDPGDKKYPTGPSIMNFKIPVPVRNTKITYRENTSTTVNQQLFFMAYCNATGGVGDAGIRMSVSSKLTFYDTN